MRRLFSRTTSITFAVATAMVVLSSCNNGESSGQVEDTAPQNVPPAPPEFVDGEVLIKFKDGTVDVQAQSTLSSAGLERVEYYEDIAVHLCRTTTQDVAASVQACAQDPNVEYVEPNYIYRASEVPNDPRFAELWALQNANDTDIDADEAWDVQTGSRDVVVAIIDTGVDHTHEDIQANMWRNPGESGDGKEANGVDDDANGFVDDVFGWDFVNDDNDPMDDNAHGTHVAGTVAAVGDNTTGVVGVNWTASIMALKFLDGRGSGSSSGAIRAILYAAANGAHVQSNSWGGGGFSQALRDAIEVARDQNQVFVAAAGNDGRNNDQIPTYPSNYEVSNVVAVAASDRNDQRASFSNFGKQTVDVAAPGTGILSSTPGNRYQAFDGTSMATPHVSGVVALVVAQYPGIAFRDAMIRTVGTSDPKAAFDAVTVSGGRLNAARAIAPGPAVAFVTRLDDTPDVEGPYFVQAEATGDRSISEVELVYAAGQGPETVLPMDRTGAVYAADIPGQALGTTIAYFVKAKDDAGNSARSATFQFAVGQGEPGGPPCGNFAMTVPGSMSGPKSLAVVFGNAALAVFVVFGMRRMRRTLAGR